MQSYFRQYFPTKQYWLYPTSMDNMIKQWHSIESVFNYMESFNQNYTHIGLFRTDQLYRTSIDILNHHTTEGDYLVRANYGLTTAKNRFFNDRLIYGTYDYVKIWATKRFSFVEDYLKIDEPFVRQRKLHSETFLYYLMKKYVPGRNVIVNDRICAQRIRSQCKVVSDCKRRE